MIRKHAIMIALTFLFLGMMFTSVETPYVSSGKGESTIQESPEIYEQITEGPVPQEPLRLNVLSNPSFEDWDYVNDRPEDWNALTSPHQFGDRAYTEEVANGAYAGYLEGFGGSLAYAQSRIYTRPKAPIVNALLEPGISLSFNWNALAVPDMQIGSEVYFYLSTNGGGGPHSLYYYLATGNTLPLNTTDQAHIMLNDTLNQWNNFERNITEDYIDVFGSGDLTSTDYVSYLYFYAISPTGSTDMVRAVFDDVLLFNSTYTEFLENGDFETGLGSPWFTSQLALGQVEQSPDSTSGSYSVNATVPNVIQGYGFAQFYRFLSSQQTFYAITPRMSVIQTDWKYNDSVGFGVGQYAYLKVTFHNTSDYVVHYYFGSADDAISQTNSTGLYYVTVPGFGTRDSWVHSEIDLYDAASQLGLGDLPITNFYFYVYNSRPGASVELLIDDFNLVTYPVGEPGFEYDSPIGVTSPYLGWTASGPTYDVFSKTTDAHGGTYANNMTAFDDQDVYVYREGMGLDFDAGLFTDFWWRLDDVTGGDTGYSSSYIQLKFSASGLSRYIRYMLANNEFWIPADITSFKYIYANGFNQTGVWTRLHRNITSDIITKFSVDPTDWTLEDVQMWTSAGIGLRTSIIFDDMNFIDAIPPIVNSVSFDATPMYYEEVSVRISTTDARPGVSSVFVGYSNDSWSSADFVPGIYDEGDWYNATIPARAYNNQVEFYIQVTDGCGVEKIDDNEGLFYSYTVGDDVDPTLTITNPLNNTDQYGLLTITADVADPGSGIEWVRFNADGSGAITDYDVPYQQNWNLDDETLGTHFVIVTVRDNAGHEVTKTHYFTIVDTTDPVLSSPSDISTTYIMGSEYINWTFSDARPDSFSLLENGTEIDSGVWPAEGFYALEIDPTVLSIGHYNYTIVLIDEAGNTAVDTVMVEIYEILPPTTTTTTTTTTPTSDTTTTGPGSTDTSTDTTTGPTGGGDILSPVVIVAVIGVIGILLVVVIVIPKMKKT